MAVEIQLWPSRIRGIEIDEEVSEAKSLAALVQTLWH
jgi:hypothetical protein